MNTENGVPLCNKPYFRKHIFVTKRLFDIFFKIPNLLSMLCVLCVVINFIEIVKCWFFNSIPIDFWHFVILNKILAFVKHFDKYYCMIFLCRATHEGWLPETIV